MILYICAQVPGRVWDGKESVLAALAAVTKACSSALNSADGARVVAALIEAAGRKKSDFRQARFGALYHDIYVQASAIPQSSADLGLIFESCCLSIHYR